MPGNELVGMDGLLDDAPVGFVSFDDAGRIRRINTTLLEMLGASREALVGRHVENLLTVGSRVFYQTHLFPLVRLHGRADEIFLLLKAADGADIGVLVNIARRDRNGAPAYDAVMMRVRERQKYEAELLRARRVAEQARTELEEQALELEATTEELLATNAELMAQTEEARRLRGMADAANRSKSDFLSMMSHELRTPLNAIGGYVQILEMGLQGAVNEQQLEMLSRIDRSQAHLLGLINDILDLSKLEAGGVEYVIEDVVLIGVVEDVVPMVEPQIAEKELLLEAAVPAELSARADQGKLRQILINLLSNAIKFTSAGGSISIRAGVGTPTGHGAPMERVFLAVQDTGVGIAPEQQSAVFEPFVQVHARSPGAPQGTGLGLAISRDLARGMGGDLTLESEPDAGSTFTLVLPRA